MDGIKDLMAKRELRDLARRSRMGRLAKARKGEVVASHKAAYGFRFNGTKDAYELDREKMAVVGRIFKELAVEGKTLYAVRKGLQAAGIPTPTGKKIWHQSTLRNLVENDAYRAHTYEEARSLVLPVVAAALDPDKLYGILWWGKRKQTKRQTTSTDANGKSYGYTYKVAVRPREEWVAIPVPNSGVPREWVDKAREAIKHNTRPSSCGRRFWELSGGILRCAACGCTMQTTAIRAHGKNMHFYYRCPRRVKDGKAGCANSKNLQADAVEPMMWEKVSDLLKSPQKLTAGLDKKMEQERERLRCDPKKEVGLWTRRVEEYTLQRENRLQQHAEGLIGLGELRERLSEIDEARGIAEGELERLRNVGAELARLERDKEDLMASYAGRVPDLLDNRTPEQRHQIYRMLRIEAVAHPDGRVEATGDVIVDVSNKEITNTRTASSTSARSTRTPRASRRR